jgi:signal transduction histidine kinase
MANKPLGAQVARSPLRLPRRRKALTPLGMALLMACAIFICEVGVMFVLSNLPPLSREYEAIIDSTILLTFLTPFYFLLYRPFWEEHKQFEGEIQHLSQKLLSSAEEERKRISHDLHDQCGQTLTAIQFGMDALRKSMPGHLLQQKEDIRDIVKSISQLGNEIREITYQLRPAMLDEMGLVSALRSLVSEVSRQHPTLDINEEYAVGKLKMKLPPNIEVALYRTCQESLNNIIKYAQASEVSIILGRQETHVVLSVQDNGIGLDTRKLGSTAKSRQGIGLLGMRERVAALQGEFEIISEPGKGTSIIVALPVSEDENG